MTKNSPLDSAILAHLGWLERFQNNLDGIDNQSINLDLIRDDTICEFGKWFHANPELFPEPGLYNRIKELHRLFHEHASEVSAMLNHQQDRIDIEVALFHLKESSSQLLAAMRQAKAQLEDQA